MPPEINRNKEYVNVAGIDILSISNKANKINQSLIQISPTYCDTAAQRRPTIGTSGGPNVATAGGRAQMYPSGI